MTAPRLPEPDSFASPGVPLQHALERLAWKYRRLHALRQRREEAEAQGLTGFDEEEGRARRRIFARLAREFPGALRELDTLSASRLRKRLEQIERAALFPAEAPPPWIPLILDYHRSLRQALSLKRWLARRIPAGRELDEQVVEAFRLRLRRLRRLGLSLPAAAYDEGALRPFLSLLRRPPGGRLLSLVWAELAERHGQAPARLEAQIFPSDK